MKNLRDKITAAGATARINMIINWTAREQEAIQRMARTMDMSEEAIVRQALRLYDLHESHIQKGHQLAWVDAQGQLVREPIGGGMGD